MLNLVMDTTGMAGFIEGITTGLTSTTIWNEIIPIGGLVATLALVKIGYHTVKKAVNNSTRPGSKKVIG